MSYIVNKTYTPTCSGALLDEINANATIAVACEQIVYLGTGSTDFFFVTPLSAPQLTELDNVLATFVCPVLADPVDDATLSDTTSGPDVLWSSDKIISELTTNIDHTNLLNRGTNTHAQLDSHVGDTSIHYTQSSIDHTNLLNRGTNTHAQLDTFVTETRTLEVDNMSTGVVTGGALTAGSGNVVNIAAGTGYVNTGTSYDKLSWGATTVATVADGTNYISIQPNGTPVAGTTVPPYTNLVLGKAYAAGGNTTLVEVFSLPFRVDNFSTRVNEYVAFGKTRVSGCSVHEKLSPNFLELDIGSGTMHSHLSSHDVPDTSTFTKLYNTSDLGWMVDSSDANKVSTSKWNDVTQPSVTALVTMTPMFWKKDIVIRTPGGNVYYVYGQREYQTFEQAHNAQLPTIPPAIATDVAYLAYIIVQQGATTIGEFIRDITPSMSRVYGYGVESHGSGSHSNGYSVIDHEHHIGGYTNSSTGLLRGGALTINANPATFDLATGTGVFVDNTTDPLYPTINTITWPASTAVTVTNLATQGGTYVGVDVTGAIQQSATPFTFEQTRTIIPLGFVGHPNNTAIAGIVPNVTTAFDPANRLNDLISAIGVINVSGNQYAPNGANLTIDKSSGKSFSRGVNFHVDRKVPDVSSDPTITAAAFGLVYSNGSGGYTLTSGTNVDTNNYDDGSGTLAAIPAGNWVSIPVYFVPGFGTSGTYIQYPQRTFATQAEAVANTPDLTFVPYPGLSNASLRTYIVVQKGTTDLSNPALATFIQGGKFNGGLTGGSSGGAAGGAPEDASYIVTVADPTLTNEKVIGTDFFVTNAHVGASAGIVESKLALNFATHSNANDPTASQKAALAGTSGVPSDTNQYVTNADSRMTDARTPTSHVIITNLALGPQHTISGATAGHVFRATGATTATMSQLSHTELGNIGTNTHAQIDTHLASTSNPHNVTANQVLPSQTGNSGRFLTTDGNNVSWATNPLGTVTSVGLSAPSMFTVTGSPVTTSGTLALALATQASNTVLAGPTTGTAVPTFRTLSLATNAMSDVTITSPVNAQILTYNSGTAKWVNSTQTATSFSALISSWTLVSGNQYYADVVHNLGTVNVVISLFNATTNALIQANSIVLTNANTARITVTGIPAYNIRCNVIANGTTIAAGGSTPSSVIIQQNGVPLAGTYTTLNIDGGLTVVNSGGGIATVSASTPIRTLSYFATSLDSPNNADWIVNALAPTISDPARPAMNVRQFSNTVEQGVGLYVPIPVGATTVTVEYRGRAQTAPGTAANLQLKWYTRRLPANSAVESWTAGSLLNSVVVPTNAFTQYYSQTLTLASLGLVAGSLYQFELTRNVGVANNLAQPWLLNELTISFA